MLITFESGECGGKDTQIEVLANRLRSLNYTVKSDLWEPGSTLKSEVIRLLVKNKHNSEFKFPGDFIKTFDLAKYRQEFMKEEVPEIAAKYLNEAMNRLKSGIKYETINYLLNNQFLQNGNLAHTINYLNNEEQIRRTKSSASPKPTPAELLLKNFFSQENLIPEIQMYLYMAARNIMYHGPIPRALKKYDFVLINRSKDSGPVYQGHAQNPFLNDKIRETNDEATEGIIIDLTVLLDLTVEEVAERKTKRLENVRYTGITVDYFDEKNQAFDQKIRDGYIKEVEYYQLLPPHHPEYGRIKLINGHGSIEEVHERIWAEVSKHPEFIKLNDGKLRDSNYK